MGALVKMNSNSILEIKNMAKQRDISFVYATFASFAFDIRLNFFAIG
jgi:hypothetical protein